MDVMSNTKDIKETVNLSNDLHIQTLSNFTIIEELQNRLRISGILLAEGVWNNVLYTKDQIKIMFDKFKGKLSHLNYKVEHERTQEFGNANVGVNSQVEWSDTLGAILYKADITNPKIIEDIKSGLYTGTSMKLAIKKIIDEKGVVKALNLEPIDNSVTSNPACDPSRIIISREELNSDGMNSTQTFSIVKEEELNKESDNMNETITKVSLNEQELEHFIELANEAIKRKRITYEYVLPKETSTAPVVEQPKQPELNLSDDFTYQPYNDKFIVIRQFGSEIDAKSFVDSIKGKTIFMSKEDNDIYFEENAVWTTAFVNNLPDSCFAYIEPGGKQVDGKTEPRSLRHLPYKDSTGKCDPAHVRNALARLSQTNIPDSAKASAKRKLVAAAKTCGVQAQMSMDEMDDMSVVKNKEGTFDVVDEEGTVVKGGFKSEEEAKSYIDDMECESKLSEIPEISTEGLFNIESGVDMDVTNPEELMWEETDQFIRSGHGKGNFDPKSYRTVMIDKAKGIKAIVGCPTGHFDGSKCDMGMKMKSLLFPKSSFNKEQAQEWFKSHNMSKESISSSNSITDNMSVSETMSKTENNKVEELSTPVTPATPVVEAPKVESSVPLPEAKQPVVEPKTEPVVTVPKVEVPIAPKEEPKVVEQPKVVETPKVPEPVSSAPLPEVKVAPVVAPVVIPVVTAPVIEPVVEKPKAMTNEEIVSEVIKNKDLLADLLISMKKRN
jgi:hypothetical protein